MTTETRETAMKTEEKKGGREREMQTEESEGERKGERAEKNKPYA